MAHLFIVLYLLPALLSEWMERPQEYLPGVNNNDNEERIMAVYDDIGGEAAVDAAVDIFYRKVLADKRVNEFFSTVDMEAQRDKQKSFLTMAFGGPNNYTGKDLRQGHSAMNLNEGHFTAVAEQLVATLEELKVPQASIDQIMAIVGTTKDDVLNR